MKHSGILLKYEWIHFKSEKGLLLFTLLMLFAGMYGIYSGTARINRQVSQIAHLRELHEENVAEMKEKFPGEADAGDIAYYHPVFAAHHPGSWAALSTGQRDINPPYLKIRLLALQNQLYNAENTNPYRLATGSFDLAFVFIYLFPLYIIALGYNIISAEKERGTLALLLSQPVSTGTVIFAKVLFRVLVTLSMAMLLTIIAILTADVAPDARIAFWVGSVTLYCLFWFGLVLVVTLLNKTSAFNAVALLGIWMLLSLVIPSIINVYVSAKLPASQGLELTIKQREEVHAGWDRPKEQTLQRFFVKYPQWTDTTTIKGRFAWRWYYAFQELGDRSVEKTANEYKRRLLQRQQAANALSSICTPSVLLNTFNAIAGSDLKQHLQFIKSVEDYHESLKGFYYPFLFKHASFKHEDFAREPTHSFVANTDYPAVYAGLSKLFIHTILVFAAAFLLFRINKITVR